MSIDLRVVSTIGEYAFRRIATGWFLRLLALAAIIILYLIFTGGPKPELDLIFARARAASLIDLTTVILVIVMGATELPRDIDTRIILLLLSRPVTKDDVVLGKFLGLVYVAAFTTLVLVGVTIVGSQIQSMRAGVPIHGDLSLTQKVALSFLQAVVVSAVVVLLSTRLSEVPIIFFTATYTILGFFIRYVQVILLREDIPPPAAAVLNVIYYMVPNFFFYSVPPDKDILGDVSWAQFGHVGAYTVLYSGLLLALAIRSFHKREVAG